MTPKAQTQSMSLVRENLVATLGKLPENWALTPVNNKRALRNDWQTEPALNRGHLAHQILNGTLITKDNDTEYTQTWNGYGIRTGNISGGLLGIDVDGPDAELRLQELCNGNLPVTISWTSGKPDRVNRLYQLPKDLQEALSNWTGKKIIVSPGQDLHFRYNSQQQVLPPSIHPETGIYTWLQSPIETEITPVPDAIVKLIWKWITPSESSSQKTPAKKTETNSEWPLLPPIRINGPGETNDCLRQLANWGYNRLNLTNPESLGDYITENAPKLPGWKEFVSGESKLDLGKNWGYRWAKSACKYWTSPKAQYRRTTPDTQWQDWLQEDSIARLQWCIDKAKDIKKKFPSLRQAGQYISELAKERFGKGFSKRTLWKEKEQWKWLVYKDNPKSQIETNIEPERILPEVPNGEVRYQAEYKDLSPVPDLNTDAIPVSANLASKDAGHISQVASTPLEYRKGDKVIVNDGTCLPYCGKVATVQARVKDALGNRCYRLDLDYWGRAGTKARKFEALPQFLSPAPVLVAQTSQPVADFLEATTEQLDVILGTANPFSGPNKLWRVTPAELGKHSFRRLQEYLRQRSTAYA
jgi:hypothetical protein